MPSQPLVSIICLCYNHEQFVEEAILSALNQHYPKVEVIVVDDASTDNSRPVIDSICQNHSKVKKLYLDENVGNTKAFNMGYQLATGDYIIDFATDDVLMPDRLTKGLETFQQCGDNYDVNFCNAEEIDEKGQFIKHFYELNSNGNAKVKPQEGNLYQALIEKHFICSPTMLVSRKVFDDLKGYDETLAYEDFDFWLRSSKKFKYCYTDQVLVKRRRVQSSMSSRQYAFNSAQMRSTYKVLEKAFNWDNSDRERTSIKKRIGLEMRQCIKHLQLKLLVDYFRLLRIN